jgi:hypothetical protein
MGVGAGLENAGVKGSGFTNLCSNFSTPQKLYISAAPINASAQGPLVPLSSPPAKSSVVPAGVGSPGFEIDARAALGTALLHSHRQLDAIVDFIVDVIAQNACTEVSEVCVARAVVNFSCRTTGRTPHNISHVLLNASDCISTLLLTTSQAIAIRDKVDSAKSMSLACRFVVAEALAAARIQSEYVCRARAPNAVRALAPHWCKEAGSKDNFGSPSAEALLQAACAVAIHRASNRCARILAESLPPRVRSGVEEIVRRARRIAKGQVRNACQSEVSKKIRVAASGQSVCGPFCLLLPEALIPNSFTPAILRTIGTVVEAAAEISAAVPASPASTVNLRQLFIALEASSDIGDENVQVSQNAAILKSSSGNLLSSDSIAIAVKAAAELPIALCHILASPAPMPPSMRCDDVASAWAFFARVPKMSDVSLVPKQSCRMLATLLEPASLSAVAAASISSFERGVDSKVMMARPINGRTKESDGRLVWLATFLAHITGGTNPCAGHDEVQRLLGTRKSPCIAFIILFE